MRVWDVHPGYLSQKSLLGQHTEIHGIAAIISGNKKGYSTHPETQRWRRCLNKIIKRHDLTVKEMDLRGFKHASPCSSDVEDEIQELKYIDNPAKQFDILMDKYSGRSQKGRIPLPIRGSDFWSHHKYSVMARGYSHYKIVQEYLKNKQDLIISEEDDLIKKVLEILERPVVMKALINVTEHLWGYFKRESSGYEKEAYLNLVSFNPTLLVPFLYELAQKYDKSYLLRSTIFADFTEYSEIISSAENKTKKLE